MKSRRDRKTSVKKIININHKIILDFFLKGVYVSFRCRSCSSVVEHVIGNDGVASPILASGTSLKNQAKTITYIATFFIPVPILCT